ncbi:hypothetical protein SAMD00019534_017450 [Acytostelium subglobosum LB1]|uniref:hypothetical protein n=1 Tax=Acytostelium subglobosum LB1 TaxID=1410327 RepID=UPI0006450E56|nr:hypothetical protein SAMD00019534_017450 [Acytostelium subglobosum LB1]GAM18570.1 hypothetical protein SAMD00019534_017450 [Acytostelium subglobosum LB1]|eukprot:XP_012757790.1 hypothetical protein SAMD00019534_017450 [Acytostelium subglobosum LB1]
MDQLQLPDSNNKLRSMSTGYLIGRSAGNVATALLVPNHQSTEQPGSGSGSTQSTINNNNNTTNTDDDVDGVDDGDASNTLPQQHTPATITSPLVIGSVMDQGDDDKPKRPYSMPQPLDPSNPAVASIIPTFKRPPVPNSNSPLFSVIYDKSSSELSEVDQEDMLVRTNLQKIVLSRNRLTTIPERIGELLKVHTLDFSYNLLQQLPTTISSLNQLTTLLLAGNQLLVAATDDSYKDYVAAGNIDTIGDDDDDVVSSDTDAEEEEELWVRSKPRKGFMSNAERRKSIRFPTVIDFKKLAEKMELAAAEKTEVAALSPESSPQPAPFESLPTDLSYLPSLTKLDLSANVALNWQGMTYLPPSIFWYSQITTLLATHCQLFSIPSDFQHLTALTQLDLSHNELIDLPLELGLLSMLKHLSLQHNRLQSVPGDLSGLSSLMSLDMSHNELVDMPTELGYLFSLETIDLSFNQLACIPDQWFASPDPNVALFALKDLKARRNCLDTLPANLFQCGCPFERLDLSENRLISLPDIVDGTSLESLSTLLLFGNKLQQLPNELIQYANSLSTLNLSDNSLTSLPSDPSIWLNCQSLSQLYLGHNKLTTIQLPTAPFYALEELYLNGNDLASFDQSAEVMDVDGGLFPSLRELSLGSCSLTQLPTFIYACQSIDKLDLSNNQLNDLDMKLADLTSLSVLDLSNNMLTDITTELLNQLLKSLTRLDLSFNSITESGVDQTKSSCTAIQLISHHNQSSSSPTLDEWSGKYRVFHAEMKGRRPAMEDAYTIQGHFRGDGTLIALFDGHAGAKAADFCSSVFPEQLKMAMGLHPAMSPSQWLQQAYTRTNAKFRQLVESERPDLKYCGATAAAVLIHGNSLHVANIGDSRVVLCRDGKAMRLSLDHKPSDPKEDCRIRELGGYIVHSQHTSRIKGTLAVSRAIGDFYMEPYVIADAHQSSTTLDPKHDQFLIVACDGIWDEVDDQQACDLVLRSPSIKQATLNLRDYAYFKGSDDNITVIVVDLTTQS